jgi:hypothetical protein
MVQLYTKAFNKKKLAGSGTAKLLERTKRDAELTTPSASFYKPRANLLK